VIYFLASFIPNQAMGKYANNRSVKVNHKGEGRIITIMMPPIKKRNPAM
jgi:hypothetical protein